MWYNVSIGSCEVVRFSLPDFHSGHTGSNPVRNTHQPLVIDCDIVTVFWGCGAIGNASVLRIISTYASLAQLVERRNHNS